MRRSVLVLSFTLAAAVTTAQEHPWTARFQAGRSTIHEWGERGAWGEARIGQSFVGGVLSADLGLAVSSLDGGYGSLTAGLEVLPFPRRVVSPFARAEVGLLGAPEPVGYLAAVGGGLAVRLSDGLSLRGGATWGTSNGYVEGPVVYYGGLELRW